MLIGLSAIYFCNLFLLHHSSGKWFSTMVFSKIVILVGIHNVVPWIPSQMRKFLGKTYYVDNHANGIEILMKKIPCMSHLHLQANVDGGLVPPCAYISKVHRAKQ